MNGNDNSSMNREINILDLIYFVMSKWKTIFIVAIIFMLLSGVYSYMVSSKNVKIQQTKQNEEVKITEQEVADVEMYATNLNSLEILEQYKEESPWMNMDTDSYYEADLQYLINLSDNTVNETETGSLQYAISLAYKSILEKENFRDKLNKIDGFSVDEKYYNEVIDLDNVLRKKVYGGLILYVNNTGILNVTIRLQDENTMKKVVNLVESALLDGKSNVDRDIAAHELILLDDQIIKEYAGDVLAYQKTTNASITEMLQKIKTSEENFSPEQFEYYEQNYSELGEIQVDEEEKSEQQVEQPAKPTVNIKLVIVGFVLGCMLTAVIYVFIYLLNTCLIMEDDFEKIYGQKLICRVAPDCKKIKMFFVDKFILKLRRAKLLMFNEKDAMPMITTTIRIACKKQNINKVVMTCNKLKDQGYVENIKKALEEEGIDVFLGNSVLYDYKTLEAAAEEAYIVLFEQAGTSEYLTIQQEIDICNHNDITIVGAVVVS